jgi:hypothetical protein
LKIRGRGGIQTKRPSGDTISDKAASEGNEKLCYMEKLMKIKEPGAARRSQKQPGGVRSSQEGPASSSWLILAAPGSWQ